MPGLLDPAERDTRVRGYHLIDENHAGLELVDEALAFVLIVGPGTRAQPEAGVVSDADRLVQIFHTKQRGHRTKKLLPVRRRIFGNVGQHGRGIVVSRQVQRIPASQYPSPSFYRLL